MRELTIDELNDVSGGATLEADFSAIVVTAHRMFNDFWDQLFSGGTPSAPEDIVVTAHKPTLIDVGGGEYARLYPDGIAQVYADAGDGTLVNEGNFRYKMDTTTTTVEHTNTASLTPSDSLVHHGGSAVRHWEHTDEP